MTRNAYLVIGLILVLVIAGLIFIKQRGGSEVLAPTGEELPVTPQVTPEEVPTSQAPTQPLADKSLITYTNSGFSPAILTVKAGETVIFKNNSSRDFRPASAIHPTHAVYPEKGGCIGSKFDACSGIGPGGSWSFTFNLAGTWKYHDHLNASRTGTIIVK